MKSQTKALVASVMVLALALSSVGGVTYSWFSDTQTHDIGITIGEMEVDSSITIDGNTIKVSETTDIKEILTGTSTIK